MDGVVEDGDSKVDESMVAGATINVNGTLRGARDEGRQQRRVHADRQARGGGGELLTVIAPTAGALVIVLILRDLFHVLFHPAWHGGLSMRVFGLIWRLAQRRGERALMLAGPVSMLIVIVLWGGGLVVGWALVYWPFLPESFILASPLQQSTHGGFVEALYFSMVTQATLGYGDIAPRADLLRVIAPLQAIIGFGLFTGAITWVLSVYPALARQRTTATLIAVAAQARRGPDDPDGATPLSASARRLEQTSEALATCRVDLLQYPSIFYFAAPDRISSLAVALPRLAAFASTIGAEGSDEEIRLAVAEIGVAIDQLAATIADRYLDMPGAATDLVMRAYAEHHAIRRP